MHQHTIELELEKRLLHVNESDTHTHLVLAGGFSLWAVSPRVVFPPAVFGDCPPPVLLSRVVATFLCDDVCLLCRPGV